MGTLTANTQSLHFIADSCARAEGLLIAYLTFTYVKSLK